MVFFQKVAIFFKYLLTTGILPMMIISREMLCWCWELHCFTKTQKGDRSVSNPSSEAPMWVRLCGFFCVFSVSVFVCIWCLCLSVSLCDPDSVCTCPSIIISLCVCVCLSVLCFSWSVWLCLCVRLCVCGCVIFKSHSHIQRDLHTNIKICVLMPVYAGPLGSCCGSKCRDHAV